MDEPQRLLFGGYLTRIEELQPYNNGNPAIWGLSQHGLPFNHALPQALDRLAALDNIDKHRVVHATWSGVDFLQSFMTGREGVPADFKFVTGSISGEPLEDGAQVGNWRFETRFPMSGIRPRWT